MALRGEGQTQNNRGAECFLHSEEDDEVEEQIWTTLADSGREASEKKAEEGEGGHKEEETAVLHGQPECHAIKCIGPNEASSLPMPDRAESGTSDTASDATGVSGQQPQMPLRNCLRMRTRKQGRKARGQRLER